MVGKSYEERISNERNDAFDKLQSQLTAAQAHIALLRDAAGKYYDATSKDDRIADALGKALAIPNDDTALREWGARLLERG